MDLKKKYEIFNKHLIIFDSEYSGKESDLIRINSCRIYRFRALFAGTDDPLWSVPQDPSACLGEGLLLLVSTKEESGAILLEATDSLTFRAPQPRGSLLIPASVEGDKGCARYRGRCTLPGHGKFTGQGAARTLTTWPPLCKRL